MNEHWFAVLYRWFGGALLCFFAFAPVWIGAHVLLQLLQKPQEASVFVVTVLGVCAAIAYFLLLLAYRAFTGRGRKQDDGLLPPWAMKGFIHAFGVVAVCIVALGIYQGELRPIVGGIAYLLSPYGALYAYSRRHP
jgi:hypothetical protein